MRIATMLLALLFAAGVSAQGRFPPSGQFGGFGQIIISPQITVNDARLVKQAPAIASGVLTLNLATGNFFNVPLGANITTMTVSNAAASGTTSSFTLLLRADGTPRTIAWMSGATWANNGGVAPTPTSTSGKCDKYTWMTWDGGTTWYGTVDWQNVTCGA